MTQSSFAPARKLGLGDIVLLVVGSVIGSGIFLTPAVVAQRLRLPSAIVLAWVAGGVIALFGAFVLGELAVRRPEEGGAYAYLRDAFHPVVAFAYGWTSLLASFSGGLAAAAVLFAGYFASLTGLSIARPVIAVLALAVLALVNALGVREGSAVQNGLTVLKVCALAALVIAAFVVRPANGAPAVPGAAPHDLAMAFALALVPVLFSYNGAVAANFMAAEVKHATRALPVALWLGIAIVTIAYVLVNAGCIRVLGIDRLAASSVPVSAVLRIAAGPLGERLTSLAIVVATLGFMSSRMLSVPRLYRAMAADGLFFQAVGRLDPRTRVPVIAIALQGAVAIVIALSGTYEHILDYVVSTFYLFNGLLAIALFVLRTRDRERDATSPIAFRVPGHPYTTTIYLIASWGVTIASYIRDPGNALAGLAIVLSAVPVYLVWMRFTPKKIAA